MTPERRSGGEVRVSGRTLSGVAMPYGTIAPDFRERFEPGAFGEVRAIDLNLQHDPAVVVVRGAALSDSPVALSVSATLPEGAAALALVRRRALNGFSIEFKPTRERRDAAGVRVVEAATLTGLALVDRPAYPAAGAEVRARSGRRMRSRVPYDRDLACECIGQRGPGSGGTCIPIARFAKVAGEAMAEQMDRAFAALDRDVLAVAGDFRRPLGSVSKGTLRGRQTDDGLDVEIDLPAGAVGDEIIAAHETAGVVIRPLIDFDRSEFVDTPEGRQYTRPHLRAFLVGATDTKAGWPDPTIDYDVEGRAAPVARRRLWL